MPHDQIAQRQLRSAKLDRLEMHRLRRTLTETHLDVTRLTDDELIAAAAGARPASGRLTLEPPEPPAPEAPAQRPMSGYFTTFKWVRGQSLEELEKRIGYGEGMLTSKGALIYKFLRVPELNEFEVRGYSMTSEKAWNEQVAPGRAEQLAKSAAYHKATKVPSFDEKQKMNAREAMGLSGASMLVKVYPLNFEDPAFPPGSGIPQWRLTNVVRDQGSLRGQLLFTVAPGNNVPADI